MPALALVAPLAGAATYLWWVGHDFGDWAIRIDAFPQVMAPAMVTSARRAEQVTTAVCAVGLAWMCGLAWLGVDVP